MRPLDASRFIYSLVGTMVSQPWTPVALRTALRASSVDRPIRVPRLAERILAAFPHNPGFNELVTFLRADAGLSRAIKRLRADVGLSRAIKRSARPSAPNAKRSALLPPKMEQPPVGLKDLRIPDLPTEAALADWFAMDSQHLRWRADLSGRNRRHRKSQLRTYRYRWIARRNGPPRLLEIPKAKLKEMQKQILAEILDRVPAHPAAHGFRAGRSIVTNAIVHCGKPSVLRFDLTDFFPSVSSARVFRIFRTIGYPTTVARLLMGLCTTTLPADVWESRPSAQDGSDFQARQRLITRHLPQGAPTSPALANLAAGRLDRRLRALATAVGADYTRYADDLTFSGPESSQDATHAVRRSAARYRCGGECPSQHRPGRIRSPQGDPHQLPSPWPRVTKPRSTAGFPCAPCRQDFSRQLRSSSARRQTSEVVSPDRLGSNVAFLPGKEGYQ
jgi:hypothetical protein